MRVIIEKTLGPHVGFEDFERDLVHLPVEERDALLVEFLMEDVVDLLDNASWQIVREEGDTP